MDHPARETRRPLSAIIFESSEEWSELRDEVLTTIANFEPRVRTRVRAGMVLTTSRYVDDVTYGPFEQGAGRRLECHKIGHRAQVEIDRDRHLQNVLTCVPKGLTSDAPLGLRIIYRDALTFSDLDPRLLRRLLGLPVVARHLIAYGQLPTNDRLVFELLWLLMTPSAIVSDGVIIDSLEDSPEFSSGPEPTLLRTVEPRLGQGVFFEFDGHVYVDDAVATCVIPPPPSPPAPLLTLRRETPVGRAVGSIGISTGPRISSRDDAGAKASVSRSEGFYECPDVNVVEQKVKRFLLDKGHEMQRWVDLADHDHLDVGDGALVLASLLSSALYGDFPVLDPRPTADRALQFTVPVLLPLSRRGRRLAMTTCWTYRAGDLTSADLADRGGQGAPSTGLWLATAHVDRTHTEYAEPAFSPFDATANDWGGLVKFVESEGLRAFASSAATIKLAGGWLLVPHTNERNAAFAKWVRANRGGQVYERRKLGGRVTAFRPEPLRRLGCATGTAVALRFVQSLLGMAGIRSYVDMHYD